MDCLCFACRFQGSGSDSDQAPPDAERGQPLRLLRPRERGELEGASSGSSPRSSITSSPKLLRRLDFGVPKSRSQDFEPGESES